MFTPISSKNIRQSALLIGVILNDTERAGVTCKILVSKQIDSAAYVHTLSALFVEVL